MRANPEFVARTIADELVLVPIGSAALACDGLITCNELGAFIWKKLEEGFDEPAILADILEEYEVEEETARADMSKFLGRLRELGAIIE